VLEHRRQHYLSLLGIDNYVPTRELINAAPSTLLADELLIDPALLSRAPIQAQSIKLSRDEAAIAVATDSASLGIPVDADTVASSARALPERETPAKLTLQSLQDMPQNNTVGIIEKRKQIAATGRIEQSKSASALASVKFVFSVWRVKDILILDIRKVREALPTDYLLQNILRSIGYNIAQLPASESLRWPLFDNKRSDNRRLDNSNLTNVNLTPNNTTLDQAALTAKQYKNDKAQASAMVQAYISAQHSKSALKYLFLMGEEATIFALDSAVNFADYNGSAMPTKFLEGVQCLVMPSLYSMLQEPSSKRIAWNALTSTNIQAE